MLQVFKESFFLFLALVVGLMAVRRLDLFYKLILAQVVWYAIIYLGSYAVTLYQQYAGLPRNNLWVYNIYFPVECAILATAGIVFFATRIATVLIITGYVVFLLIFFVQLWTMNFNGFANYGVVSEAMLLVSIFLVMLYRRFRDGDPNWRSAPDIWLCLGIAGYFACIVPYFSMINLLNSHNPKLSELLFYVINEVLGNVRYLFTGISFWLCMRRRSSTADLTV